MTEDKRDIDKELKDAYRLIVKNIDSVFYNDKFIDNLVGNDLILELNKQKKKLKIIPSYNSYNTTELYSVRTNESIQFSKFGLDYVHYKETFGSVYNLHIVKKYNVYGKLRYFFRINSFLNILRKYITNLKKIDVLTISTFNVSDYHKKYLEKNIHNVKMINTTLMVDEYMKVTKHIDGIVLYRIFGGYNNNKIVLYNRLIIKIFKEIYFSKLKSTCIIQTLAHNNPKQMMDIINILSQFFDKTILYLSKYERDGRIYIYFIQKNKQGNKLHIKDKYINRLLDYDSKDIRSFFDKCYQQNIKIYKMLISIINIEDKYQHEILKKVYLYKKYIEKNKHILMNKAIK